MSFNDNGRDHGPARLVLCSGCKGADYSAASSLCGS